MTGQPDIAAALGWSEQVIRDVSYLMAALRGEPTPALAITSTPVPLASLRDREHYSDPWELALCQATSAKMLDNGQLICERAAGHGGWHKAPDGTEWRERPDAASAAGVAGVAGGVPGWNDPLPPHIALGLIGDAAGVAGGAEPGYGDCERCLSITTMWCVPATAGDGLCDDCREAGCATQGPGNRYSCTLPAGHEGWHEAHGTSPLPVWHDGDTGYSCLRDDLPGSPLACPARWGEGDYLSRCSLPSGHPGQHADHGIEYAGHWETAEPGAKDATAAASDPICGAVTTVPVGRYICTEPPGHDGDHVAMGGSTPGCRWPQDPAAGMWTGNTEATDDARNGGRARYADHLAPPAGYSLPSIERPDGCICLHFSPGIFHIADLACPVHGLASIPPDGA